MRVDRVTGLAGLAAAMLLGTGAGAPGAEPAAAGAPAVEHLAWCPAESMYLDGPALEAMSPVRAGCGVSDDDGNVWFGCNSLGPYPGARCVVRAAALSG